MELSLLIAKEIAIIYIVAGLAIIIGQLNFQNIAEDLAKSPSLTLVTGLIGLIVGVILVMYHNIWVWQWTVLITIVSWLFLLGGIILIIYPKILLTMGKFYKNSPLWGILMICFGLLFGYFGYIY